MKRQEGKFLSRSTFGPAWDQEEWDIFSNAETGDGFSDILIEIEEEQLGIELKYAGEGKLDAVCEEVLAQIESRNYESWLRQDGMVMVLKYGIACWRKRSRVKVPGC